MAVIEETDENLTQLIYDKKFIVIKYYTDECCHDYFPLFEKLSTAKKYSKICFVKINANNNPIAKQCILNYEAPILITYKEGLLISSSTIASEIQMKVLLDELIEHI